MLPGSLWVPSAGCSRFSSVVVDFSVCGLPAELLEPILIVLVGGRIPAVLLLVSVLAQEVRTSSA